ncbi:MAG: aldose epimerase family protein [Micropruina sp.]
MIEPFGNLADGQPVHRIRIAADGISADILTYGATVHRLDVAGRNVALGHPNLAGYQSSPFFIGATCGRFANRIGDATFELDGVTYPLQPNENGNILHGGPDGFDKRIWNIEEAGDDSVLLTLTSPDGDQGFPGTLQVSARYTARPGEVEVIYRADTDAATHVNLTTHIYLNLAGETSGAADNQLLQVFADRYTEVGEGNIPTGDLPEVHDRFDLRTARPVEQAAPLDHNFVITGDGLRPHARMSAPDLTLEVLSDQPGLQIYTAEALNPDVIGTSGVGYVGRAGIALETQGFPDAPNQPTFPSTVLRPGQEYLATTVWRFSSPVG